MSRRGIQPGPGIPIGTLRDRWGGEPCLVFVLGSSQSPPIGVRRPFDAESCTVRSRAAASATAKW